MKTQIKEVAYQLLQWHVILGVFILGSLITLYILAIYQSNGFDEGDAFDAIMGVNVLMAIPFGLFGMMSYSLLIDLLFGKEIFDGDFKSACLVFWGIFSLICAILVFNNFIAPLAGGKSLESFWGLEKEVKEEQRQLLNEIIENEYNWYRGF